MIAKPNTDAIYSEYVSKGYKVYYGDTEAQIPPTYIPKNMVALIDENNREIHLEYKPEG